MGGVHGASRDIDTPAGVVFTRQIKANSVEPTIASRSRNLFSHDDRGPGGTDEAKKVGPQMPWIGDTSAAACRRERLARARSGPERPVVGPAGEPAGDAPKSAAGEEMALGISGQIGGLDIANVSVIDIARRYDVVGDELAQDRNRVAIDLVVVGASHGALNAG